LVFNFNTFSNTVKAENISLEGKVKRVRGIVYANEKRIYGGEPIKEGDNIKTEGKGSFIEIEFGKGSTIRMKEGNVKISSFTKKETLFQLLKGSIFAFIRGTEDKKRFKVRTKYSSLGVRGTKFFVQETDETYLCVCEGIVEAKDTNKKSISVIAGEDLHLSRDGAGKKTKATQLMLDMAKEGFSDMGFPVEGL